MGKEGFRRLELEFQVHIFTSTFTEALSQTTMPKTQKYLSVCINAAHCSDMKFTLGAVIVKGGEFNHQSNYTTHANIIAIKRESTL